MIKIIQHNKGASMKNKKMIALAMSIFFFSLPSSFAETKKLKEVGRYTFVRIRGEVPTSEVMKALIDRYTGDIKYGFDLAGFGDLFLPFLDQVKQASFEKKDLAIGDKIMWMLFRSQGRAKIVKDLEWAGARPLPVFSFMVKKDYKNYEFVMPRPCGNIALIRVEEIIPIAICDIKVSPAKANINDPIFVNMAGTQHAKSMEVEVYDASGAKIESKTLTPDSPQWQTKFNKPGEYNFKAKAFNAKGKHSENPCEATTYINYPPVCKLSSSCLPCIDYVGRPIILDASQSSDPDGEVVKADFEIRDEAGNLVDTFSVSSVPLTWEKIFNAPGLYTVTAMVTDDFGAISEPYKLELKVTQKRVFLLVEAGPLLARGTYTAFVFGRGGFLYYIVPKQFSFSLSAGPAFPLTNTHEFNTFFMANGLLYFHADPAYFGAGLGYTSKDQEDRKSGMDVVGSTGVNIFSNYKTTGSIFFEVRVPVGNGRPFDELHKLMLGFRMFF